MHSLSVCDMYLYVFLYLCKYTEAKGGTLIWCLPQLLSIFSETGFHEFSKGCPVSSKELPISPCQHWDSDTYYFTQLCMWMLGIQTHVCMLAWQTLYQLSHLPASLKKSVLIRFYMYLKFSHLYSSSFKMQQPLGSQKFPFQHFLIKLLVSSKFTFTKSTLSQFLNNHITLAAEQRRELISTLTTHLKE